MKREKKAVPKKQKAIATLALTSGKKSASVDLSNGDVTSILSGIHRDSDARPSAKKILGLFRECSLVPPKKYMVEVGIEAIDRKDAASIAKRRFGAGARIASRPFDYFGGYLP